MYASQQDMVERFGETELAQLTDREGTSGAIVPAVLDRALADAAAEIDGHLQARYTLPLETAPSILTAYACDIARYRLFDDRATDQVTKRYESAMKFLRMLAEGKVTLGPSDCGSDSPAPTGGPASSAPERVFTRDELADYQG